MPLSPGHHLGPAMSTPMLQTWRSAWPVLPLHYLPKGPCPAFPFNSGISSFQTHPCTEPSLQTLLGQTLPYKQGLLHFHLTVNTLPPPCPLRNGGGVRWLPSCPCYCLHTKTSCPWALPLLFHSSPGFSLCSPRMLWTFNL